MDVITILEENSCLFSNSVAVIDDATGREIIYQDLWSQIDSVGYGLTSLGIGQGDRVAIFLPNGAEFIISYFAILKIGAIAVPINIMFKKVEIKRILQSSKAVSLIGTKKEIDQEITAIRHELPDLHWIVSVGGPIENCTDEEFEEWMHQKNHVPASIHDDNQPAAIHYTSGTTGQMKGAILSHYNLASNAKINGHYLLGLNDQDRVLGLSPFSHVYFIQVVLGPLYVGAGAVTLPRSSPNLALAAIEKYRVTHLSTVPTMFRYLLQQFKEGNYDISSWRVAGSAGTSINLNLVREIERTFNVEFFDTYGCTEASSTITYTRLRHYKPGSVGKPAHGYHVKITNDQGEEVQVGDVGELLVKGPGIFSSYWEMPEVTKEVVNENGWYKSGDLARLDNEGSVYMIGRKKDVIISGGYKIYPWEVEELLLSHPEISEAMVVGKADKNLGEIVIGYIIPKSDTFVTPGNIIDFCQERLAKYKCPREIIIKSSFPRTPSGKIIKSNFG
jgi:long-chain acyl-CoA synthetase